MSQPHLMQLTPAQSAAFAELGLTPGMWVGLYPLPLFNALLEDANERPALYRDNPPSVHIERLVELACDLWNELTCPLSGSPSLADPTSVRQFLIELSKLAEEPMATKIKRGTDLLAWHLAKDFDAANRDRFLARLRFTGVQLISMDTFRIIPQTLENLRERTDAHLPHSDYAPERQTPLTPVEIPHNLHALWIVPVVRLFVRNGSISSVNELIHQTKYGLLQWEYPERHASCWLLEPEWERLLRTLDIAQTEEWLARWEPLFVEQLAQLPYNRRQESLKWLNDLLNRQRRVPECEEYFQQLRSRVDTLRRVARPVVAHRPSSDTPNSDTPSSDTLSADLHNPHSLSPDTPSPATLSIDTPSPDTLASHATTQPLAQAKPSPPVRKLPSAFVGWTDALARAEEFSAQHWECASRAPLLFDKYRLGSGPVIIVPENVELPRSLWFVGDLHGDLLAAVNAWEYICQHARAAGQRPHVVFLGDYIDRGEHHHELLVYLLSLAYHHPGQFTFLVGNHDEDLRYDPTTLQFASRVDPAEYADQLNSWSSGDNGHAERVRLGHLAAEWFARLPRALFLPDGTVITHAGIPHTDRIAQLHSAEDLTHPEMLQDFVWLRLSANLPRKRPNRSSRGSEFGYADLAEVFAHLEQLGIPAKRLVRGHDHLPQRHATYPKYHATPVLTLNSMCRRLDGESSTPLVTPLCLAEHVPGELPRVHSIMLPDDQVRQAFPALSAQTEPIPTPLQH